VFQQINDVRELSGLGPRLSLVANSVMTATISAGLLFLLTEMRRYRRSSLIQQLVTIALDNVRDGRTLDESALADIVYLGEQGNAGAEKNDVIQALVTICSTVQATGFYHGIELGEALDGVCRVVLSADKSASDDNYLRASALVSEVIDKCRERRLGQSPDVAAAWRTLKRLGLAAIPVMPEWVSLRIVEVASSFPAVLHEMSTAALDCKRPTAAVAALSKLEASYSGGGSRRAEVEPWLLAAAANFFNAGGSLKKRAEAYLRSEFNAMALIGSLGDAESFFFDLGNFRASDEVSKMRDRMSLDSLGGR
jgi:hypothetical protein